MRSIKLRAFIFKSKSNLKLLPLTSICNWPIENSIQLNSSFNNNVTFYEFEFVLDACLEVVKA